MNPRAAQRIKDLVDELSALRLADLANTGHVRRRLSELHSSLAQVEAFIRSTTEVLAGIDGRSGRRGGARPAPGARRRGLPGKRSGREFGATPFILQAVREAGKGGIRPRDIVAQIRAAAPGRHVQPSALVSTILTRLRKRGEVKRRAGRWYPAAA